MKQPEHYLVVDLEATCSSDNAVPRKEMELIEIGAVMAARTLEPLSEFQTFVVPQRHPQLTPFCTELTSIVQSDVDSAPGFVDAMSDFLSWTEQFPNFVFCSWGAYDRKQFQQDCSYHGIDYPLGNRHINLKAEFGSAQARKPRGLGKAVRSVGLSFVGSHHRGIDDARNIASLLPYCDWSER